MTEPSCKKCGNCCRTYWIFLFKEDILRISSFLKIPTEKFLKNYTVLYVLENKNAFAITLALKRINGSCIMLENNLCKIYPVRPKQCELFPFTSLYKIPKYDFCPYSKEYVEMKGDLMPFQLHMENKKMIENFSRIQERIKKEGFPSVYFPFESLPNEGVINKEDFEEKTTKEKIKEKYPFLF